jgi:hypothetical protein
MDLEFSPQSELTLGVSPSRGSRDDFDAAETRVPTECAERSDIAFGGRESVVDRHSSGLSLGRFVLLEPLGSGTFGTVWKAHDTRLDRLVALKVARTRVAEHPRASVLLREARLAACLRHPNIVRVFELGGDDGAPYIVSDLVDGVTLADRVKARRPSPREAASLCIRIARALQYAHGEGIVHRDLKPGNIMLGRDGEPYLLDFGLAVRVRQNQSEEQSEPVLGTPAYMPPEQARGGTHPVDGRADVYSLGVILYELLAGRRPFRGPTPMLLHQLLTTTPPSPRTFNRTIPRDLEAICLTCLGKRPSDRYASAGDLADDLERFLAGLPVRARRLDWVRRGARLVRRRPLSTLALSATLLACGLAAYQSWRGHETDAQLASTRLQSELLEDRAWIDRMTGLARTSQYALAVAEARRVRNTPRLAPSRYYDLACIYSLAAGAAARDPALHEPRRRARAQNYTNAALALLHTARDAGYFVPSDRRTHLLQDSHLEYLRGEHDLKSLILGLKEHPE